jgi:hypothetical protein
LTDFTPEKLVQRLYRDNRLAIMLPSTLEIVKKTALNVVFTDLIIDFFMLQPLFLLVKNICLLRIIEIILIDQ